MKILKILLVLLIPALGFVSCEKSGMKPSCPASSSQTPASDSNKNNVGAKSASFDELSNGSSGSGTEIVGTGDDDRDGGDKKTKKVR